MGSQRVGRQIPGRAEVLDGELGIPFAFVFGGAGVGAVDDYNGITTRKGEIVHKINAHELLMVGMMRAAATTMTKTCHCRCRRRRHRR
jgi:hypothetical protein